MRILVIGAVAAGTSAAAKARRNDEEAAIAIYEKGTFISYSGCGMPYYFGGLLKSFQDLVPRDPAFFKEKYNVDVFTKHEVIQILPEDKKIKVRRQDGTVFEDTYDQLVLATGARAVRLPIEGHDLAGVFTLRSPEDTRAIEAYMKEHRPQSAVIIGSGFIGLEMVENLKHAGMNVTLVEKMATLSPNLDPDMSRYLEKHLEEHDVPYFTDVTVSKLSGDQRVREVVLQGKDPLAADLVIMAVGIRPETDLARQAGVKLGKTGAIQVDRYMKTNVDSIYACGDCCESFSVIDGQPLYRPLGSTANKMGRIAGDVMTGGSLSFRGIAGTSIFRLFDLAIAQTGMTETQARTQGFDVAVIHNTKLDRPAYTGGQEMIIKAVADQATERLLGVQIIGREGVDKRIDVFATAITYQAKASELADLDLAYAPPFSTTKDPVIYTGMILDNAINRGRTMITCDKLRQDASDMLIIDTRSPEQYKQGHVPGAINMPHHQVRKLLDQLPDDKVLVTYCNKGTTGNAVQNILIHAGHANTHNLSGGHQNYCMQFKKEESTAPVSESDKQD